ncbi:MAG: DUF2764 domain-containing protein [Alistipes sp.]|jgi:hypothetical protein|nr:DUF2764 domain-containing protein [Alistipes sp.]
MFGNRQYYTLVAGLREYAAGAAGEKGFSADAVYGEVRRELSRANRRAAGLLWSLMNIYGLGRERIEELYSLCDASPCDWLRDWAVFDRNLRNVIAAHTARTKGRAVADSLLTIEGDKVAVALDKSSAADFNLRGELDYMDRLLTALSDAANIMEKERAIDNIRWEKADSLAEGDTFGASAILAYLVKVAIIGRWVALDPQTGREMYERLVRSMSDEKVESKKI